jgi:hypothetical protein
MPALGRSFGVESKLEGGGADRLLAAGPESSGADRGWWWPDPGEEATDRWRGGRIEEGEAATELTIAAREAIGGPASDPATAGWVAADPVLLAGGRCGVDRGGADQGGPAGWRSAQGGAYSLEADAGRNRPDLGGGAAESRWGWRAEV